MAKQVMQFRYYGNQDKDRTKNYPSTISQVNLQSGSIFADYMPIVSLGIQTLPGTKFCLNNSNDWIIVGTSGIYELDIDGMAEIMSLKFSPESITNIKSNPSAYLMVDIVYKKE